jgi:sulfur-oxidizing protein SoxY
MKRRQFLALGFVSCVSTVWAKDYRMSNPYAWESSSIDVAAVELYGKEKFSTIQKSTQIELVVPSISITDSQNIPITIRSNMKASSLAIFQDTNPKSLIAVFHLGDESIVDYTFMTRMDIKGTLFAVLEGLDGKLYYARKYIDIVALGCMSSDE